MYQKGKITKWPSFYIYICHPLMLRFLFCKFCCNSRHDEIALGTCMFDCKFVLHKSSNVNFACLDLTWSLVKLPMDGVTCRSKHRRRRRGRKWRATPTSCSARSWRVSWEYLTVFVFNRHVPEVVNVFFLPEHTHHVEHFEDLKTTFITEKIWKWFFFCKIRHNV